MHEGHPYASYEEAKRNIYIIISTMPCRVIARQSVCDVIVREPRVLCPGLRALPLALLLPSETLVLY